jgi:AcrR family transcriptional regulator
VIDTQPPPHPRSHRDPQATIRKILEAARTEFGANGFDGTRVEHIARRARVSKQIVYFYFRGKDELYWELLKDISIKTNRRLLDLPLADLAPGDAIRAYIEEVYDIYAEDPVLGMVSLDQSMHGGAQLRSIHEIRQLQKSLADRLADVVRRGQAEDIFHADIDGDRIEFMTVIITVGCLASSQMLERYSGRKWQQGAAETRAFALDFIMRALRR